MDLSNLIGSVPLSKFTKDQKRVAILTWVAENIKIRWKDYNVDGCASGFSQRLWGAGRGEAGNRGYMPDRAKENVELLKGFASTDEETNEIMKEVAENIIENAVIFAEDLLKAARNAKTENVRKKYLNSMQNQEFMLALLQISLLLYSKEIIHQGHSINHEYLTVRIQGSEVNKHELSKIWIEYSKSPQAQDNYLKAVEKTNQILNDFEKEIVLDKDQMDRIIEEKLVYSLVGPEALENYLYGIMDSVRARITGEIRLIPVTEMNSIGKIAKL
ncbi:hypothetical protein [uncultured Ilyobacter sp.]|uniref:hypothetical protein n=1 Tax=uncultured Ilyobacter sp. TaxID=544433 RepID=UPI0029F52BA5|nr:hypothetical protein [uncultured Ilyobacter sp.]